MHVSEISDSDRDILDMSVHHSELNFADICEMVRSGDLGEYRHQRDMIWETMASPLEEWDTGGEDLRNVMLGLMANFEVKFSWPVDERYSSPGDEDLLDLGTHPAAQPPENKTYWPFKIRAVLGGDDLEVVYGDKVVGRGNLVVELGRQYGTKTLENSLGQSLRLDARIQHALEVIRNNPL